MRSFLFVPGIRPERFNKALASGADAVILDLEDAVGEPDKAQARQHVADAVAGFVASTVRVLLRVNGFGTPWFDDDLSLLALDGIDGVVLPKAESAAALEAVAHVTAKPIFPLIESALGVWQVLEVAQAPGVERLVFGSVDFELDLDCAGSWEALLYARSRIVRAEVSFRRERERLSRQRHRFQRHGSSRRRRNAEQERTNLRGGRVCKDTAY